MSVAPTSLKISNLHEVRWDKRAAHSEIATVKLSELLTITGVTLPELTHVAVNVGPGSFTGIRVGLSLARSLAYSLNLPIAGINSLENLALAKCPADGRVFVALKAVQNFFYCAGFELLNGELRLLLEPQSAEEPRLAELIRSIASSESSSTKVLVETQTSGFEHTSSAPGLLQYVARGAGATVNSSKFSTWQDVEPLYIRGSEAEEKLKQGLLKSL
jgi:tRNA threonylcarbamoyl adenosine modification protein YeaZ